MAFLWAGMHGWRVAMGRAEDRALDRPLPVARLRLPTESRGHLQMLFRPTITGANTNGSMKRGRYALLTFIFVYVQISRQPKSDSVTDLARRCRHPGSGTRTHRCVAPHMTRPQETPTIPKEGGHARPLSHRFAHALGMVGALEASRMGLF